MNKLLKNIIMASVAVAITGCSSALEQKIAKNEAHQASQKEIEQAKREIDILPSWVLDVPAPDATGYYAIGYGESKVIFKAIKKSVLQAEFGLAKVIKQEISVSERAYEQDSGVGTEQGNYQVTIDKIVDSVFIVGYSQVEQKAIAIDGKHAVYTLLKMPYEQYNKILIAQRSKALNKDSEKAFDALQERLEKRQKQRVAEDNLKHNREMEKMELEHKLTHPLEPVKVDVPKSASAENSLVTLVKGI
jgi:hypothetical protein